MQTSTWRLRMAWSWLRIISWNMLGFLTISIVCRIISGSFSKCPSSGFDYKEYVINYMFMKSDIQGPPSRKIYKHNRMKIRKISDLNDLLYLWIISDQRAYDIGVAQYRLHNWAIHHFAHSIWILHHLLSHSQRTANPSTHRICSRCCTLELRLPVLHFRSLIALIVSLIF